MASRNCSVLIMTRAGGIATQTGLTKAEALKIHEHYFPKREPMEFVGYDEIQQVSLLKDKNGLIHRVGPPIEKLHDVVQVEVFVGEEE